MLNDLRFAFRMLRKSPGFSILIVLTLALGIGGTTAIFSVIYGAALNPFPYADSRRLAVLVARPEGYPTYWKRVSVAEFLDYREQNRVFDEVIGGDDGLDVRLTGTPEVFGGVRVTGNTFSVLGVAPLVGRTITLEDAKPDAPPVVVLSHNVWQGKFGADTKIVGRVVTMNHQPTTIIGVMPPRFSWLGADSWFPAKLHSQGLSEINRGLFLVGRLRRGVTIEQATADVMVLAQRFSALYVKAHPKNETFGVESLLTSVSRDYPRVQEFRRTAYFLLGAVGLLLLIACVNVANLLLSRAAAREREIAIRASLGASRGRLVRQLMVESLLLAFGGAVLGCLFAWDLLEALVALFPPGSLPKEVVIRLNGPVLLFTMVVALLSTTLFGLGPALHAVRRDLQGRLKAGSKGGGESRRHGTLQNLLVVSEVTLSLVLLTGTGLLVHSFFTLHRFELGFNARKLLVVVAFLPQEKYETAEQRNQFHTELLRRVRALPGVPSASLGWPRPPIDNDRSAKIEVVGKSGLEDRQHAGLHHASDYFFQTFGIRLLQGRTISEEDMAQTRKVVVINRAFVTKYFESENPLGRQIKVRAYGIGPNSNQFEVVGVVADIRNGPETPVFPEIYVPYTVPGNPFAQMFVQVAAEPASLVNAVRREVAAIDKEVTLGEGRMVQDQLDTAWFSGPRFVFAILGGFAAVGLALVSIGVYSVLSYAVSRRTQEIGIRMALGAQATDVRRMVMMSGLRWLGVGIGIGVPASIALARILQNRIWGIKSADALTLIAVSLLMTVVGLAACYFPSRRATKVDPMVALRCE